MGLKSDNSEKKKCPMLYASVSVDRNHVMKKVINLQKKSATFL